MLTTNGKVVEYSDRREQHVGVLDQSTIEVRDVSLCMRAELVLFFGRLCEVLAATYLIITPC